ncbi:MAG: hypothetical protein RR651_15760, partial [Lysinibacillus sp.]
IMPSALQEMRQHKLLTQVQLVEQLAILRNAPLADAGYYAKYYDIASENYVFDTELHMIDQLYTAYHKATLGEETKVFKKWLLALFKRDSKLYGRYDASSGKPAVSFESPAVYAMATRYMVALGDEKMAKQFFKKMESLKVNSTSGYIDPQTKATHIFDNLLPLLAEREVKNANSKQLE